MPALKMIAKNDIKLSSRQIVSKVDRDWEIKFDTKQCSDVFLNLTLGKQKPARKPCLTTNHVQEKRKFVNMHEVQTVDEWNRVVSSYGKEFNVFGNDSVLQIRTEPHEELKNECVVENKKFSVSVMIWGAICSKGVGRTKICIGTIIIKAAY